MDTQKNLFILFGEWLQARQARRQASPMIGRPVGLPAGCPPAAT